MVLKDTKATPLRCIKKASRNTDPASTIANPSPASKSFFHKQGLWAESIVIQYFDCYPLLSQRCKTPFAEVDLVFEKSPQLLLMVEVKTISNFHFLPHRIRPRQKQRLFRASEYLREKSRRDVEINWAFVTEAGEVLVIEDVCG